MAGEPINIHNEQWIEWTKDFKREMLQAMEKLINNALIQQIEKTNALEKTVQKQSRMIKVLMDEQKNVTERIIRQEAYSMRENIIISGLEEKIDETEQDLLAKVRTLLDNKLKLKDHNVKIARFHRLSKNPTKDSTPRNVVVRLEDRDDVSLVLKNANKLKGENPPIYINQQYPMEIVARRRILLPVLRKARDNNMRATLVHDKLLIDGSTYTVDNIGTAPLDLASIHQMHNASSVAYLGQFSPLSNFHPVPITIDNTQYSSVEQAYQASKASFAKDQRSETKIMMMNDPYAIKRAGDAIQLNSSDLKTWDNKKESIMKEAMTAKFTQHEGLTKMLLNTGERKLLEASMDKFWGCGRRLTDPDIMTPKKQVIKKARNVHGKILEAIRTELKNNTDA